MDDQHYVNKTYSGPGLVQLWDVSKLEYNSRYSWSGCTGVIWGLIVIYLGSCLLHYRLMHSGWIAVSLPEFSFSFPALFFINQPIICLSYQIRYLCFAFATFFSPIFVLQVTSYVVLFIPLCLCRPDSQPALAYGLAQDKGFIWHLKWCPAGGWEPPSCGRKVKCFVCKVGFLQHDFLIDSTNICGLVLPYSWYFVTILKKM